MKLLIVSHTPHYLRNESIVGWGPTIHEINYLASIFDEVIHLGILHNDEAPSSALPYLSANIRFVGAPVSGGKLPVDKASILLNTPNYLQHISQLAQQVDVIQVRCPANISLLAIIWLAFSNHPKYRWAKYAGNWKPTEPTALSYTFQRIWLAKGWHRGVTTVNGRWPDQPDHVHSFHNPSLTQAEIAEGQRLGPMKTLTSPIQLLYVGAVNRFKGTDRVLQIAQALREAGKPFELNILGDGPERPTFEEWSKTHGLSEQVHFRGWLPHSTLSTYYAKAHFLLHPTQSDGWPKVISEAMAYGVVPLAGAVSSIPQILEQTGAGQAMDPQDINGFFDKLIELTEKPGQWKKASQSGLAHAHLFTYEAYLAAVKALFQQAWDVNL